MIGLLRALEAEHGEEFQDVPSGYANRIEQNDETLTVTTITGGSRGESSYDRTYIIGKESQSSDREGDPFALSPPIDKTGMVSFVFEHWPKSATACWNETK